MGMTDYDILYAKFPSLEKSRIDVLTMYRFQNEAKPYGPAERVKFKIRDLLKQNLINY